MFLNKNKKRIFLDYASSTPVSPRVEKEMERVRAMFANPSALYEEARQAKEEMEAARAKAAGVLNCRSEEIFFTSGGTESNNLALLGCFEAARSGRLAGGGASATERGIQKPHVVVTNIEHSSILETVEEIRRRGGEVTVVPAGPDGIVSPEDVARAVRPETVLVSVMYANNEIGTIQPIREIARRLKDIKKKNSAEEPTFPYFHTDACQAALYLSLDTHSLGVDLLTLDGIKIYGPRGAGLLFVRSGLPLSPIIFGGGQERGLRSGTENLPAAVGLAAALAEAAEKRESESVRLSAIRDYAIRSIVTAFPYSSLNGSTARLPNNINICFPGLDAEFAVVSLDVAGIACSHSSSCQTLAENSSSYVVSALGKPDCALSSLRFTFGRDSKKSDVDALVSALKKIVR